MGTYRSKKDDVAKISTTVYVTNFPESISAKDLFHSCKVYGHVVDSFIPIKRAKNGKRFGFVRFINVFSEERLVNNLCTVWIDRYKLHANISRFHRNSGKGANNENKGAGENMNAKNKSFSNEHVLPKGSGIYKGGNSYVKVLKGDRLTGDEDVVTSPAVVLDDVCLMTRDLSNAILGRVNEFDSLANLKMALCNEGFVDIKIQYMGEFWVMMKFANKNDYEFRENVKCRILTKMGRGLLDVDDPGRILCFHSMVVSNTGWVPDFAEQSDDEDLDEINSNDEVDKDQDPNLCGDDDDIDGVQENSFGEVEKGDNKNCTSRNNKDHMKSKDDSTDSVSSGHFKKSEAPRTGGSILGLLDEVVKVGQIMGYKMEGCMSNMAEIIEVQGAEERCWGNLTFDYVHSAAVGNSGGILCVWDPNCFCKENITMSDSFVMIRGVWRSTGQKYMLIAVYAPHDTKDKHMLWDYLQREIKRWKGGCEQDQFQKLEDLVRLVILTPIDDRWIWGLENTGEFSVASVRRLIDDKMLPSLECKTRWINYVPIKVNVHAWKVMTDSLPTRFNISRRGISIDYILCANCDTGVETSRHLFFSCRMAREVMKLITRWWNVPESDFDSYEEWLAWFENVRLPLKNKKMLEGVFYVLWWLLWWFRNKTIFE
ncbi:RNA-directed DNA polymerase, eukaryota, partial [Tanacetum coccineum]